MRKFKWIAWNLDKIAAHGLSAADVEASFDLVLMLEARKDASFRMYARTPSGRRIWVIWRYNSDEDELDIISDLEEAAIFVITAY